MNIKVISVSKKEQELFRTPSFVSTSEKRRMGDILQRAGGSSILTVSDVEGFCEKGGIIELLVSDDRLRFEVNLAEARRTHLQLSSKLLALAKLVRDPK